MRSCMMLLPLECEEFVNRADRRRVAARDPHFPAPRAIDRCIADRRAPVAHHGRARHDLRVHLEGFREVARAERRGYLAHVHANRGDGGAVGVAGRAPVAASMAVLRRGPIG